jgi:tetratricopeptide (TPR) repeat protein
MEIMYKRASKMKETGNEKFLQKKYLESILWYQKGAEIIDWDL